MRTIAIVEDNPDNQMLLEALLEDDYKLNAYMTGVAALEGIAAELPDLVLMDISLPQMDGTEVLAELRKHPRTASLPIVALTAHAMAGDEQRFLSMGFNGYLSKPIVDEDVLYSVIAGLLPA